jgi:hypothetical protein
MYTNAQWANEGEQRTSLRCDINGVTSFVPVSEDNSDYTSVMALVLDGQLTIAPFVSLPESAEPTKPTLEELQAQLAAISAQIQELVNA